MTQFDPVKAVKYTFEDENWFKRIGIILIVSTIIGFAMQFADFTSEILSNVSENTEGSFSGLDAAYLGSLGLYFFVLLVALPFQIYMLGYRLITRHNVMKFKGDNTGTNLTPLHDNIGSKYKEAGVYILINIVPTIIVWILTAAVILGFIFAMGGFDAIGSGVTPDFTPVAILIPIFGILFIIILSALYNLLVLPAIYYIYLTNGKDIAGSLSPSRIWNVIAQGWKDLIVGGLLAFAMNVVAGIASLALILCCIGFFVGPAIQVIMLYAHEYILGQIYAEFESRGV